MVCALSTSIVAPSPDICRTTQSIDDWPKLEMTFPASSVRRLGVELCSGISVRSKEMPVEQTAAARMND
jgi:hypothetical protein